MNNEVERYVGELRDLRRVNHTILKNKQIIEQWITQLEKNELQDVLKQLLIAHDLVHIDKQDQQYSQIELFG